MLVFISNYIDRAIYKLLKMVISHKFYAATFNAFSLLMNTLLPYSNIKKEKECKQCCTRDFKSFEKVKVSYFYDQYNQLST